MNTILKCLFFLILLAAVLVLLTLAGSAIFGFSFGVRIEGGNHFRTFSRMELMTVFGVAVIVAIISLAFLRRLQTG